MSIFLFSCKNLPKTSAWAIHFFVKKEPSLHHIKIHFTFQSASQCLTRVIFIIKNYYILNSEIISSAIIWAMYNIVKVGLNNHQTLNIAELAIYIFFSSHIL